MMEGQLLEELRKCDDDAFMEEVPGAPGVYRVTTTLPLHAMNIDGVHIQTPPPLAPEPTLVPAEAADNIYAALPENVAIVMAKYLFMSLALCAFCALLFTLPLYMWSVPRPALITLQVLGAVGMALAYVAMCVLHSRTAQWPRLSLCALCSWCLSLALMLSAAAGLAHSLAPYQLLALWWVQCVALTIYLQWMGPSAHHASRMHACLCMAVGTLVVWGLSIATFVHDSDWSVSLVLLALALVSLLYAAHQMHRAIEERRYAKTRLDLLAALINYHTDVPVELMCERE